MFHILELEGIVPLISVGIQKLSFQSSLAYQLESKICTNLEFFRRAAMVVYLPK